MKKIIALAVAAAISAPAMADLTLSAETTFGWIGDNTTGEGFGSDGSSISLAGSETLENGLTVAGGFGFENGEKSEGVVGTGSNLSVAGDFGTIKMENGKFGSYTESFGTDNFVGEFDVSGSSTESGVANVISYTAPAMGPVTLVVDTADSGAYAGSGAGEYDPQFTALIKAGGFSGRVAYKVVDAGDNRVRVGGTYDFGAAKVGASYQKQDGEHTYVSYGVSVPVGAATSIGLSRSEKEDLTGADTDLEGTSFNVTHALSSNVSASFQYDKYDTSATAENTRVKALMTLSF